MKKMIVTTFSFLALVGCGSQADKTSETKDVSQVTLMEVCALRDVPQGWVVYGHSSSPTCPGTATSVDSWDTYRIKKPGDVETVCADSPIPSGYMRKNPVRSIECIIPMFSSINYTNAYVIQKI